MKDSASFSARSAARFDQAGHDVIAARRTLLFVSADEHSVSPSLANAVRHEFSWLDVCRIGSVTAACNRFETVVSLILVDLHQVLELEGFSSDLRLAHPHAGVAFFGRGAERGSALMDVVIGTGALGLLPMTLPLDIWLAALRVLLLGGEYYSSAFVHSAVRNAEHEALSMPRLAAALSHGEQPSAFRGLTARELQILELVSRGQQNKLIASVLRLSEHTVKIHLHNIIAKLGVHNRTEAASFFLAERNSIRAPALAAASISVSP
jgi:DNA-binding NarL/FixJ family response regulator